MEINFVAVFVAALAAFFLGFFWYTIIFAKPWQKEIGMGVKPEGAQPPSMGMMLGGSFVLEVLMALVLAYVLGKDADAMKGLITGGLIGLAMVGFAFGVNYLFEGKSLKHWLINAGYNTVVFAVMGLIIGAM
ncbi:MAG: DUF1761 domain-containing protein [Candidatus Doudnabacteria bacterium]|nr:DUF1761 domain-containing protein [Candidatus Doudnabacteria bacterium]